MTHKLKSHKFDNAACLELKKLIYIWLTVKTKNTKTLLWIFYFTKFVFSFFVFLFFYFYSILWKLNFEQPLKYWYDDDYLTSSIYTPTYYTPTYSSLYYVRIKSSRNVFLYCNFFLSVFFFVLKWNFIFGIWNNFFLYRKKNFSFGCFFVRF